MLLNRDEAKESYRSMNNNQRRVRNIMGVKPA